MIRNLLVVLVVFFSTVSYAGTSVEELFFEDVRADALKILTADNMKDEKKEKKLSKLITKNIAKLQISRSVLGQPWRDLTKSEKREYVKVLSIWIGKIIARRLISFKIKEDVKIVKVYKGSNEVVIIRTKADNPDNNKKVTIDWYIRTIKNSPKVIDIAVENVSMISTQRSEFISVYSQVGIRGLIDKMKSHY
ncbi:MAG: ABC transporter substrate-binding protein [Alphaproteobacteria bacterium]